jgi:hypothetical protein
MCYLLPVLKLPRAYKKMQAVDCKIRGSGVDKKNDDTFELLAIFNQGSKDVTKASLLLLPHLFCSKKIHTGMYVKTKTDTSIFDSH